MSERYWAGLGDHLSGKTKVERDLILSLDESFRGDDLRHHLGLRDGGLLAASAPHVGVITTIPRSSASRLRDISQGPWLMTSPGPLGSVNPKPNDEEQFFWRVQTPIMFTLGSLGEPREVPGQPEALAQLANAGSTNRMLQLEKLASALAVLSCSNEICSWHVNIARLLAEHSDATSCSCRSEVSGDVSDDLTRKILIHLRACRNGASRAEINRLFGGKTRSSAITAALGLLAEEGIVRMWTVSSSGRPAEWWGVD